MKVIYLETGKVASVIDIPNTLDSIRKTIKCDWIEPAYFWEEPVCMIVDEEGKINGKSPNRAVVANGKIVDVIYGDAIICGVGPEDFEDVDEKYLEKFFDEFYLPIME